MNDIIKARELRDEAELQISEFTRMLEWLRYHVDGEDDVVGVFQTLCRCSNGVMNKLEDLEHVLRCDTEQPTAASVAADDAAPASTSDDTTTEQDDRSPMIGMCPSDTLFNVAGALGLLGQVDDSEDHDEGARFGRGVIVETMRRALEFEAARVQHKRKPEADVLRQRAEWEAAA